MKTATLLIIALSHAAHWLSGTNTSVRVGWAAQAPVVPAVVQWELRFDGATVSSGKAPLADAKQSIEIQMVAPTVRVQTILQWRYRLTPAGGGADIETGSIAIQAYPTDLIGDYSKRYESKNTVVVDTKDAISQVLTQANVKFMQVDDVSRLETLRPDVVIVAEDMVSDRIFGQGPLTALTRSGSQVMLLRQSHPGALLGYRLMERNIAPGFVWKLEHPLLQGLDRDDLASLLGSHRQQLAIQLPADEAAMELAYWPAEDKSTRYGPIDALLVTKRSGAGRLILCQIPIDDLKEDPRSRIFFNNALNYLSTRPEPTPRPSERSDPVLAPVSEAPTIRITPGGQP